MEFKEPLGVVVLGSWYQRFSSEFGTGLPFVVPIRNGTLIAIGAAPVLPPVRGFFDSVTHNGFQTL